MKVICLSGLILAFALAAGAQQQPMQSGQINPATQQPTIQSQQPVAPEGASNQVGALLQQLDQSAISGDTSFLSRVLADDYQAINPQGKREDRNYVLQREKDMKYESINIIQGPYFQPQGNDSVVESNVAQVRGTYKGQRFDGTYQSTRVWQMRDGQWKIVSLQVNQVH